MKICLVSFVAGLMAVAGCNSPQAQSTVVANSAFPAYLAGTWQAEDSPWQIILTTDGRVGSAYVSWDEWMKPNQTTTFKMRDGNTSHITAGDFLVKYRPEDDVLFVSIELKDIHIFLPGGVLDGNSVDIFEGPVSGDGYEWYAEKTQLFDYGPRFPMREGDDYPAPMVFRKVEEEPDTTAQ